MRSSGQPAPAPPPHVGVGVSGGALAQQLTGGGTLPAGSVRVATTPALGLLAWMHENGL